MAVVTFAKEALAVGAPHDGNLSYATRDLPEGQTNVVDSGAPVVITGGYVVSAADPVTAITGISIEPGHNTVADGDENMQVCPLTPRDRTIIVTLLGVAGVDYALLGTETGLEIGVGVETIGPGAKTGWIGIIGGTGFEIVSVQGDQVPPGRTDSRGEIGDINARVQIVPNADILSTNS